MRKFSADKTLGLVFGFVVGDALGVPFEFTPKSEMSISPFNGDMIGYGTHNQPAGTWSDDSSLSLCLLEAIAQGYSVQKLSSKFVNWYYGGDWAPHGKCFDIGMQTSNSIDKLFKGASPFESGGKYEYSNGNGSLMRISPSIFLFNGTHIRNFELVSEISSITHAHIRSVMACYYYAFYLNQLTLGYDKFESYHRTNLGIKAFSKFKEISVEEKQNFDKILSGDLLNENCQVIGNGYVINSLESALHCFLTTNNYTDCISRCINLGEDTDTTAAIAGALAGYYYGYKNIPSEYIEQIAKKDEIFALCENFIHE